MINSPYSPFGLESLYLKINPGYAKLTDVFSQALPLREKQQNLNNLIQMQNEPIRLQGTTVMLGHLPSKQKVKQENCQDGNEKQSNYEAILQAVRNQIASEAETGNNFCIQVEGEDEVQGQEEGYEEPFNMHYEEDQSNHGNKHNRYIEVQEVKVKEGQQDNFYEFEENEDNEEDMVSPVETVKKQLRNEGILLQQIISEELQEEREKKKIKRVSKDPAKSKQTRKDIPKLIVKSPSQTRFLRRSSRKATQQIQIQQPNLRNRKEGYKDKSQSKNSKTPLKSSPSAKGYKKGMKQCRSSLVRLRKNVELKKEPSKSKSIMINQLSRSRSRQRTPSISTGRIKKASSSQAPPQTSRLRSQSKQNARTRGGMEVKEKPKRLPILKKVEIPSLKIVEKKAGKKQIQLVKKDQKQRSIQKRPSPCHFIIKVEGGREVLKLFHQQKMKTQMKKQISEYLVKKNIPIEETKKKEPRTLNFSISIKPLSSKEIAKSKVIQKTSLKEKEEEEGKRLQKIIEERQESAEAAERGHKGKTNLGSASLLELVEILKIKKLISKELFDQFSSNHTVYDIIDFLEKFTSGQLDSFDFKVIPFTLLDHRRLAELLLNQYPRKFIIGEINSINKDVHSFLQSLYDLEAKKYFQLYRTIDSVSKITWWSRIMQCNQTEIQKTFEKEKEKVKQGVATKTGKGKGKTRLLIKDEEKLI